MTFHQKIAHEGKVTLVVKFILWTSTNTTWTSSSSNQDESPMVELSRVMKLIALPLNHTMSQEISQKAKDVKLLEVKFQRLTWKYWVRTNFQPLLTPIPFHIKPEDFSNLFFFFETFKQIQITVFEKAFPAIGPPTNVPTSLQEIKYIFTVKNHFQSHFFSPRCAEEKRRDPIFSRFSLRFFLFASVGKWSNFSWCQNVIGSCYHDYKAE